MSLSILSAICNKFPFFPLTNKEVQIINKALPAKPYQNDQQLKTKIFRIKKISISAVTISLSFAKIVPKSLEVAPALR